MSAKLIFPVVLLAVISAATGLLQDVAEVSVVPVKYTMMFQTSDGRSHELGRVGLVFTQPPHRTQLMLDAALIVLETAGVPSLPTLGGDSVAETLNAQRDLQRVIAQPLVPDTQKGFNADMSEEAAHAWRELGHSSEWVQYLQHTGSDLLAPVADQAYMTRVQDLAINTTVTDALMWVASAAAQGHPSAKVALAVMWLFADRQILKPAAWTAVSQLLHNESSPFIVQRMQQHLNMCLEAVTLAEQEAQGEQGVQGGDKQQAQGVQSHPADPPRTPTDVALLQLRSLGGQIRWALQQLTRTPPSGGLRLRSVPDAQLLLTTALADMHMATAPLRDVQRRQHALQAWWARLHERVARHVAAHAQGAPPGCLRMTLDQAILNEAQSMARISSTLLVDQAKACSKMPPTHEARLAGGKCDLKWEHHTETAKTMLQKRDQWPHMRSTLPDVEALLPTGEMVQLRGTFGIMLGLGLYLHDSAGMYVGVRMQSDAFKAAAAELSKMVLVHAPAPTFSVYGTVQLPSSHLQVPSAVLGTPWGRRSALSRAVVGAAPSFVQAAAAGAVGGGTEGFSAQAAQDEAWAPLQLALRTLHRMGFAHDELSGLAWMRALLQPSARLSPVQWPHTQDWRQGVHTPRQEGGCHVAQELALLLLQDALGESADSNYAGLSPPIAFFWEDMQTQNAAAEAPDALDYTQQLAEQGDGHAAQRLGQYFFGGDAVNGVGVDMRQAMHWWQRAAEAGVAAAHTNLGMMYVNAMQPGAQADNAEGGFADDMHAEEVHPAGRVQGGYGAPAWGGDAAGPEQQAEDHGARGGNGLGGGGQAAPGAGGGGLPERAPGRAAHAHGGVSSGAQYDGDEDADEEDKDDIRDEPMPSDPEFDPLAPRKRHLLVQRGDGALVNVTGALYHYHKAAALGSQAAYNGLGYIYMTGMQGMVPVNMSAAALYFAKAADAGVSESAGNLAVLYLQGQGVPRNGTTARKLLEWMVGSSNQRAKRSEFNLGLLHSQGWDPAAGVSCTTAVKYFAKALERGRWLDEAPVSADRAVSMFLDGLAGDTGDEHREHEPQDAVASGATWDAALQVNAAAVQLNSQSLLHSGELARTHADWVTLPRSKVSGVPLEEPVAPTEPAAGGGAGGVGPPGGSRPGAAAWEQMADFSRWVWRSAVGSADAVLRLWASCLGAFQSLAGGWQPAVLVQSFPSRELWRVALRHEMSLAASGLLSAVDNAAWLLERGEGRGDWGGVTYPMFSSEAVEQHVPLLGFWAPHLAELRAELPRAALPAMSPANWVHSLVGRASSARPQRGLGDVLARHPRLSMALALSPYTHSYGMHGMDMGDTARTLQPLPQTSTAQDAKSAALHVCAQLPGVPLPQCELATQQGWEQQYQALQWAQWNAMTSVALSLEGVQQGGRRVTRRMAECVLQSAWHRRGGAAGRSGLEALMAIELPHNATNRMVGGLALPLGGFPVGVCPSNSTLALALLRTAQSRGDAQAAALGVALEATGLKDGTVQLLAPSMATAWRNASDLADGAAHWGGYLFGSLQWRLAAHLAIAPLQAGWKQSGLLGVAAAVVEMWRFVAVDMAKLWGQAWGLVATPPLEPEVGGWLPADLQHLPDEIELHMLKEAAAAAGQPFVPPVDEEEEGGGGGATPAGDGTLQLGEWRLLPSEIIALVTLTVALKAALLLALLSVQGGGLVWLYVVWSLPRAVRA